VTKSFGVLYEWHLLALTPYTEAMSVAGRQGDVGGRGRRRLQGEEGNRAAVTTTTTGGLDRLRNPPV